MKKFTFVANARVFLAGKVPSDFIKEFNVDPMELKKRERVFQGRIYPLVEGEDDIKFQVLAHHPKYDPAMPTVNVNIRARTDGVMEYLSRGEESSSLMLGQTDADDVLDIVKEPAKFNFIEKYELEY